MIARNEWTQRTKIHPLNFGHLSVPSDGRLITRPGAKVTVKGPPTLPLTVTPPASCIDCRPFSPASTVAAVAVERNVKLSVPKVRMNEPLGCPATVPRLTLCTSTNRIRAAGDFRHGQVELTWPRGADRDRDSAAFLALHLLDDRQIVARRVG